MTRAAPDPIRLIIGPIVTFVVLLAVGFISFPNVATGLVLPLAFGVIAFLEGHFITPTIIGRRLALNALAVFLALAFWSWLWRPIGTFLASRLAGCDACGQAALVAARRSESARPLNIFVELLRRRKAVGGTSTSAKR